jgi:hypothetical protein
MLVHSPPVFSFHQRDERRIPCLLRVVLETLKPPTPPRASASLSVVIVRAIFPFVVDAMIPI